MNYVTNPALLIAGAGFEAIRTADQLKLRAHQKSCFHEYDRLARHCPKCGLSEVEALGSGDEATRAWFLVMRETT